MLALRSYQSFMKIKNYHQKKGSFRSKALIFQQADSGRLGQTEFKRQRQSTGTKWTEKIR